MCVRAHLSVSVSCISTCRRLHSNATMCSSCVLRYSMNCSHPSRMIFFGCCTDLLLLHSCAISHLCAQHTCVSCACAGLCVCSCTRGILFRMPKLAFRGPLPCSPAPPPAPPQTSSASQLAGALAGCLQDACGCRELTVLALGRQGSCCSAQPSGRLNASACAKSKQIDEQNLSCAHLSLVALPPVRDDCSRRTAARLLHANLRGPTFPLKGATLPAGMRGTPIDVIPLNCLCGWCSVDGNGWARWGRGCPPFNAL